MAMTRHTVGKLQQIIEQAQLCHDIEQLIAMTTGCYRIDQHEQGEADDHHSEEFHEVRTQKLKALSSETRQPRAHLVLHHQSIGTEEQEHRHAVMAKERQQVQRQIPIGRCHNPLQRADIIRVEEVLVFTNDARQPMAEVMQEDADDGHSPQGIAFRSCQKFRSHFFILLCLFLVSSFKFQISSYFFTLLAGDFLSFDAAFGMFAVRLLDMSCVSVS